MDRLDKTILVKKKSELGPGELVRHSYFGGALRTGFTFLDKKRDLNIAYILDDDIEIRSELEDVNYLCFNEWKIVRDFSDVDLTENIYYLKKGYIVSNRYNSYICKEGNGRDYYLIDIVSFQDIFIGPVPTGSARFRSWSVLYKDYIVDRYLPAAQIAVPDVREPRG